MTRVHPGGAATRYVTPYLELDRASWARLRRAHPLDLTDTDVERLSGLGDPMDLAEVAEVYLPLSRLLTFYVEGTAALRDITAGFLDERPAPTPFVVGIAGSVAVGKSTTARILRELLSRWPSTPTVQLVTTDGFLYPNAELARRGLLERKGFPESYDQRALLSFVSAVKAGAEEVTAPVYSHLSYDIVEGEQITVRKPDVLIVEGLNVLQPPRVRADGTAGLAVADFFDFSIYVDANVRDIRRWYVERFISLQQTAFAQPASYFHRYAGLSTAEATELALSIWHRINEPNLVQNVRPTRDRASLVLRKSAQHDVELVRLRKL